MPLLTGIIHIGMGDHAHDEAKALNRANAGAGGALSVRQQDDGPDVIVVDGRRYELATAAGRRSFAASLGATGDGAARLEQLLGKASPNARDELAQVMRVYAQAEAGERRMSRVVLSGHSVGSQIWGDHNGLLDFSLLVELASVFPEAAGQVRHVMMSACYTGGERSLQTVRRMFPALDSIWAYSGSSPGTWSGAIPHLERWERATESGDGGNVEPRLALGTRKGEFVATWNREDGYLGPEPMSLGQLERSLAEQESVWLRHASGELAVADPQDGPLRDYYSLVQRTLSQLGLSATRAAELERRRDQVIRLLYWEVILRKFLAAYDAELRAGYAALERGWPEWSRFTRRDAVGEIQAVRLGASINGAAAVRRLLERLEGLYELDADVVPTSWV